VNFNPRGSPECAGHFAVNGPAQFAGGIFIQGALSIPGRTAKFLLILRTGFERYDRGAALGMVVGGFLFYQMRAVHAWSSFLSILLPTVLFRYVSPITSALRDC
jgi:hypothetical protein